MTSRGLAACGLACAALLSAAGSAAPTPPKRRPPASAPAKGLSFTLRLARPRGTPRGELLVEGVVRNRSTAVIYLGHFDADGSAPALRDVASRRMLRGIFPPITPPRPPSICSPLGPGESKVVAEWRYRIKDGVATLGHWLWRLRPHRGRQLALRLQFSPDQDCSEGSDPPLVPQRAPAPPPAAPVAFQGPLTSNLLVFKLP